MFFFLDSVVQETSRISSGVFMVRYIKEDTQFTMPDGDTHLMRKGDRVAIYPPAIHKDAEIFEDPLVCYQLQRSHFLIYKNCRKLKKLYNY